MSNLLAERSVRVNLPPSGPSNSSLPLPSLVHRLPPLITPHSMVSVLDMQQEEQLQTVNSDLISTNSVMTADGSSVLTAENMMTADELCLGPERVAGRDGQD